MPKSTTAALRITALMSDGRLNSSDGIVMFDSLLYHAWFAKYAPEVFDGEENWQSNDKKRFGLPLRQIIDQSGYSASAGVYNGYEAIDHIHKRPDFVKYSDKLDMEKGVISETVGVHRAYRIPQITHIIPDKIIEFWCYGTKEKVEELLSYIPSLGKKNSIGYGFIKEWIVTECEKDYSIVHPIYGLMRPLPVEFATQYNINPYDYEIADYAIKPPYYKAVNKRRCYIPNVKNLSHRSM